MENTLRIAWEKLEQAIIKLADDLASKHGGEQADFMSSELCAAIDVLDDEVELIDPKRVFTLGMDPLISKHLNSPSTISRNFIQRCGHFHPYTCGNTECRHKTNGDPLLAVKNGWFCEECGYFQPFFK